MTGGEALASVLATSWIASRIDRAGDSARATVQDLRERPLDRETIARWLEVFRALDRDAFVEAGNAISVASPAELLATLMPGAAFPGIVATTFRSRTGVFEGDLVIAPRFEGGVLAIVVTVRGARALAAIDRDVRAPITEVMPVTEAAKDATAAQVLSACDFPGVVELYLDAWPPELVAGFVLRCPALERYKGPISVDVADALATTSIPQLSIGRATDAILQSLSRASRLAALDVRWTEADRARLSAAGFAALARCPTLTKLESHGLTDADLDGVAAIASLEILYANGAPITDAGGPHLGRLAKLRWLDVHDTQVGDATLCALATLPQLALVDLASTPITPAGLAALQQCKSLVGIGLAWDCPRELDDAAARLGLEVQQSDMMESMGAIWIRNPFDMLAGR